MPKILCICAGGNCRSQAMSYLLKYGFGCDALAVGYEKNSPETISMLATWADLVFVMTGEARHAIPEEFAPKVRMCDVGPDKWWAKGPPSSLLEVCSVFAAKYVILDNEKAEACPRP